MKFKELVKEIMEYESDTFSAKGSKITKKEATIFAEKILDRAFERVDGVSIDVFLDNYREDQEV